MGNYTFETIMKITVICCMSLLFVFLSKQLYNSFVSHKNEDILYKLERQNKELEHKKWEIEINHLKKNYGNEK